MTLLTSLSLLIAALVWLPLIAHRLRRTRAEEQPFAAAHLVPPSPPRARRRSKVEDPFLLSIRALSVILLALLGASPFVHCSRLALERTGGASVAVALIIDDSMSMRAHYRSGTAGMTRFARAKRAAAEVLSSMREGDSVSIVLAGSPARVTLAPTTELTVARDAVESLPESDRATDLEGAIQIAEVLLGPLPQNDRRIVLLSDLADGSESGSPLGADVTLWAPLTDLKGALADCGLLSADREGDRVRVRGACGSGERLPGRDVTVETGQGAVIARSPAASGSMFEAMLAVPKGTPTALVARLSGTDAIASDDAVSVLEASGAGGIAVVVEASDESVATGGAPVLEQALAALRVEASVRALPTLPDRGEDLEGFSAVILDDPPGLTPEQRRGIERFLSSGGVVLLALGGRASLAPLGASLDPILSGALHWSRPPVPGVDPARATPAFEASAASVIDLAAANRATLSSEDLSAFSTLLSWKDGAPLFARRPMGRGEAWISTLPFSVEGSDLVLRPAFLTLLGEFTALARAHASLRRSEVGQPFRFDGATSLAATGPSGPLVVTKERGGFVVVPPLIGSYSFDVGGKKEKRIASPVPREMDLRPRSLAPSDAGKTAGDTHAAIDISPVIAMALLLLMTLELVIRFFMNRRDLRRPTVST